MSGSQITGLVDVVTAFEGVSKFMLR